MKSESDLLKEWVAICHRPNRIDRNSDHIRKLCAAGIPSSVRGKVWSVLAGNNLQITPELYEILKAKSKEYREGVGTDEPETTAAGGKESSVITIQYDIPRTFSEDEMFQTTPQLTIALHNVLHCYAHYRPDVGYVQGMSYVAAMCVYYMDEYTAFQTLANLLGRNLSFDYYRLEPNRVTSYTRSFDHFFRRYLPALHEHLKAEGVSSDMFLMDWTLTLFVKSMPVAAAARIWDLYMLDGDVLIVKAALGILQMLEFKLETSSTEGITRMLRRVPLQVTVEEGGDGSVESAAQKMIEFVNGVPLSAESYERVRRRHVEDCSEVQAAEYDDEIACDVHSLRSFFVQLMCPSIGLE